MAFLDSMSNVFHAHVTPEFVDLRNDGIDPTTHISDLDQAPPSDARPIGDGRVQRAMHEALDNLRSCGYPPR
jgi:hypothetical protein